jgi:formylglycine-generating enzyme required for sulfatase activity
VNVVCPDNAWELGFTCLPVQKESSLAALMRRDPQSIRKGLRKRFETSLYPGGSVTYKRWLVPFEGKWQEGLRQVFQKHVLFDIVDFDSTLYTRKDLAWIRKSYVMHLLQAWDKFFYDPQGHQYRLLDFVERGRKLYGGDDVIGIWPTWPSLGLDQRNQFDLYRDLPGGIPALKNLIDTLHQTGVRLFISYNPWDESTRREDHFSGLTDLVRRVQADGIVLDTRGASSKELQEAADAARPGVVLYSEGMAVPKDMPNIVSGRVHNALYYVPLLNLNKLIKPDFSIFRVAELYKEPIRREFALAFFNGYGTEINIFAPGQPDWVEEQYRFLGRTSRILREHSSHFTQGQLTPLLPTSSDSIWVNQWSTPGSTLYTIYSTLPSGYAGPLFQVEPKPGYHFVDLWHHRLLQPIFSQSQYWMQAEAGSFHKNILGTNDEGAVDCIAQVEQLIRARRNGDQLFIQAKKGQQFRVWAGHPSYEKKPLLLPAGEHQLRLSEQFGRFEGDVVIQLFEQDELIDETILSVKPGEARKISVDPVRTVAGASVPARKPKGMISVPAGLFLFRTTHGDDFIPYPTEDLDSTFEMPEFYIDQFPVTNQDYERFLMATHYRPEDTVHFLRHWEGGRIPKGQEQFPVVYINYEDAQAYARWAGKRLPTEREWQYAAQTRKLNEWPWTSTRSVQKTESVITATLTYSTLEGLDSTLCNPGNGEPYAVGKYKKGANPLGIQDLVGCVWQMTHDIYQNGSYQYIILKGGSYYKPSSSWWYVQGGPRELHYRQMLLRVSPGFERNSTVGFRCVQ